jgi:2-methylfumaryl-CoA isomerase
MPGLPLDFSASPRQPTRPAPRLGADTDRVLSEVLGLTAAAIGRLHDSGIAGGP